MIARHARHERLDEGFLTLIDRIGDDRFELGLRPGARRRNRSGQADRRPFRLAVDQLAEAVLQIVIADRFFLADQDRCAAFQCLAPIDCAPDRVDHVFAVEHRLPRIGIARIEMAFEIAGVDARDLLRERRHHRCFVVNTRQPQQRIGDGPMMLGNRSLCFGLGFGIGPARLDRLVLVDRFAGLAGRVDQHGTGIDELPDIERLKRVEQMPRPLDVQFVVERVILAGEIEIGGKMDDARDAVAMRTPNLAQRGPDRLGGGQISLDHGHAVDLGGLAVQSDDLIVARQPLRDRTAQIARRTGQQDDWSHNDTPCS